MTAVVLRSPALWRTVCRPVRTVGDGGGPPLDIISYCPATTDIICYLLCLPVRQSGFYRRCRSFHSPSSPFVLYVTFPVM